MSTQEMSKIGTARVSFDEVELSNLTVRQNASESSSGPAEMLRCPQATVQPTIRT